MARKKVFDPRTGQVMSQGETTSGRFRNKFRSPYDWCYCELCYETTEYANALESQSFFKRLPNENARAVVQTDAMRCEAQQMADALVERYERALQGQYGPFEAGEMRQAYCDLIDMRGDRSAYAFRDQVERFATNFVWAKHSDMLGVIQLQGQPEGAAKPSRLYCMNHNPRRSIQARRNYQRDRRFVTEYEDLIAAIWRNNAGSLPSWDIYTHVQIRRAAFEFIQMTKKTIHIIDWYLAQGVANGAQIAGTLKMSRQAVSVAQRRHSADDIHMRQHQAERLDALCKKIFGTSA